MKPLELRYPDFMVIIQISLEQGAVYIFVHSTKAPILFAGFHYLYIDSILVSPINGFTLFVFPLV